MKSSIGMTTFVIALFATVACHAEDSFDSNGTKIRYTVSGKGQPVVLIHGFIGSSEEWMSPPPFLPPSEQEKFQTIFATLSKEFMVIAPDCRGHGRSGKPKDGEQYGLEMVEDIVRLDPLKAAAEATTKLLPKSKLVVLDGLDHVSTEMSPGFRKHIQSFLTANKSNENN